MMDWIRRIFRSEKAAVTIQQRPENRAVVPAEISPPETLGFCTRCGEAVDAYLANQSGLVSDYHDRYSPPHTPSGEVMAGDEDSYYYCGSCNSAWVAISVVDTGLSFRCGHANPLYAAFCATCGQASPLAD